MLGVGVAAALLLELVGDELALALELELDDELPQAETPTLAVTRIAATNVLLFSKGTLTSSSLHRQRYRARSRRAQQCSDCHND